MSFDLDRTLARAAVTLRLASPAQVEAALGAWEAAGRTRPLAALLVERGVLRPDDVARVLEVLRLAGAPVPNDVPSTHVVPPEEAHTRIGTGGTPAPVPASVPAPATGSSHLPADPERYEILDLIGRGGMGMVYRARQKGLDRIVALKFLGGGGPIHPDEHERFAREGRSAARLRHPGIVEVFDVGALDGRPYLAMEFVDGRSLDRWLAEEKPDLRTRVDVVRRVAEAVAHAHEQGIVHRDLKPGNVLLGTDGRPRVADFGLAKEVGGREALTQSGAVLGTPQYMAPEQAEGSARQADARADVYSLGAILYEVLTGRRPFDGESTLQILLRVIADDPIPPRRLQPRLHADLETICLRAMEKTPSRRYATAAELAADLGRFLAGESIEARPPGPATRAVRLVHRHRAAAVALGCAATLAIGWAVMREDFRRAGAEREAARRTAEAGEASAREALRKAGVAARVLARWGALEADLRALEEIFYDPTRGAADKLRAADERWAPIERFMKDTPDEPAARATMRALAGWARCLASRIDEGTAWMREAAALDADLPYGALLEALAIFARYTEGQRMPAVTVVRDEVHFGPMPPESPERAKLRADLDACLARTAIARVWGREGAEDLRAALGAVRAWQAGDFAAAEAALDRAAELPDLRPFASGLVLARAQVRYLRRDFAGAATDAETVLRSRPRTAAIHQMLAMFRSAAAEVEAAAGRDPLPAFSAAFDAYAAALALTPRDPILYTGRGIARHRLGILLAARKADPAPHYRASIADHGEALRLDPGYVNAWNNRATALRNLADHEAAQGRDPRPLLAQALADIDEVVRRRVDTADARCNRGDVRVSLARARLAAREDAGADLRAALEDYAAAADGSHDPYGVHSGIAQAHLLLADLRAREGGDPLPEWTAAEAAWGEAARLRPEAWRAWLGRAEVRKRLAQADGAAGADPRARLREAIADFARALERTSDPVAVRHNRAGTLADLAAAEAARGGDPRPAGTEALAELDTVLARAPEMWQAQANRGCAWEAMGDFARAAEAFQAALEKSPGHPALTAMLERVRRRAAEDRK